MKIFLTGGTGFIGSHFINSAIDSDIEIKAIKRSIKSIPKIKIQNNVEWLTKDFIDVSNSDLTGTDILVHLAAHSANVPYDTLENCIRYNVIEPLILFNKAKDAGVKKIIVTGSCFEYGTSGEKYDYIPADAPLDPTQSYPTSKAMASIAFKQFAIENKIQLFYLRVFQVFGDGEADSRFWPSLRKAALSGEDFHMSFGEQIRDFIEVNELVKILISECRKIYSQKENIYKVSNVGTGNPQSLIDFAKFWWKVWNAKGNLIVGTLPYRQGEIMRYVPLINNC